MRGRRAGQRDHHRAPLNQHRPIEVATVVVAAATGLATFLPWASSGERARSSHQLVDVADKAGILPSSTAGFANLWFLVPLLCGVVLLAFAGRSTAILAGASGILGAVVVAGGVLVIRSPLVTEPGAIISTIGGTATAVSGTATLLTRKRRNP